MSDIPFGAADIAVINQALIRLGAQSLQSRTAPNGPTYCDIYQPVIEALCAEYPWTFTTGFQQLARRAIPTANRWLYAYVLPADMSGTPLAVFDSIQQNAIWPAPGGSCSDFDLAPADAPVTDFEIMEGSLYANYTQLWMRYIKKPNPAVWPAYFRELVVKLLMAEYAIPVREDMMLRNQLLEEVYGAPDRQGEAGMIAKCKAIDSKGRPSRKIAIGANPLVTVRWT